MDKETQNPMYPAEIVSMSFRFSGKALQWLHGTTKDDVDVEVGNFTLFRNLLSGMALASGEGNGFRRPLVLSAGQAQYSEERLSSKWNMGRKRIRNLLATLTDLGLIDTHRSRVASVMTFPCMIEWEMTDGGIISNPFIMNGGKEQETDSDRTDNAGQRPLFLLFRSHALKVTVFKPVSAHVQGNDTIF